jgi:PAS domain S-box-containing protein
MDVIRLAFDAAPIGMGVASFQGRLVYVNRALCRLLGYTEAELLEVPLSAITHPDDRAESAASAQQLLRGELDEVTTGERLLRRDGSVIDVVRHASMIRDEDGRATHLVAQVRDVTDKKRFYSTVRQSEAQLRGLVEVAPDGICITDGDGRYVEANSAMARLIGVPRDELLGRTVEEHLVSSEGAELAALRRSQPPGTTLIREWTIRRPDGELVPVEVSVMSLPERRRLAFVRDIRERRRLTHDREAALAMARAVFEQCPVGIILLKPSGEVELNGRAEEMMKGAGGREWPDGSPIRDEDSPVQRALRGEGSSPTELDIVRSDGSRLPVLVRGAPLRGPDGGVEAGMVTLEDLTTQKELERLRQEWTSIVAHDLHQPVAAIRLYAQLLHGVAADVPAAREPVEKILAIATGLHRMIRDLHDLSLAELGELPLRRRPIALGDLARAAVERTALEAKGRFLDLYVRGDLPPTLADPDRIGQVLDNLLSNAVKYGAPGTPITVTVEGREGHLAVAVHNHGPGLAAEDLPRLFQRFQRGASAAHVAQGAGLGLHIARALVEAHGGHLGVESVPGATTSFRFTLPVPAGAHADPAPRADPAPVMD